MQFILDGFLFVVLYSKPRNSIAIKVKISGEGHSDFAYLQYKRSASLDVNFNKTFNRT